MTFDDVCTRYRCSKFQRNFDIFQAIFFNNKLRSNPSIRLTFPISAIYDGNVNLIWCLSNVTVDSLQRIEQVYIFRIFFIAQADSSLSSEEKEEAQVVFTKYGKVFDTYFERLDAEGFGGLRYDVQHTGTYARLLESFSGRVMPYLAVSISCLVLFTVFSSMSFKPFRSYALEAFAGTVETKP